MKYNKETNNFESTELENPTVKGYSSKILGNENNMSKPLTGSQKRNFVELGGNYCPHCGHRKMNNFDIEKAHNVEYRKIQCEKCLNTWVESWRLVDVSEE